MRINHRPWSFVGVLGLVGVLSASSGGCSQGRDRPSSIADGPALGGVTAARPIPTCVTIWRGGAGSVTDVGLREDQPDAISGAADTLGTGNVGTRRIALLRFDLGPIPAGVSIQSATASLSEIENLGPSIVDVHQVLAPWVESTATWTTFQSAHAPTVVASFFNGGAGHVGSVSFDLTDLARGWYAGAANLGVALRASTNSTWGSSEATVAAQRPSLRVRYVPAVTWAGVVRSVLGERVAVHGDGRLARQPRRATRRPG
jgi:hypothetical protein